MNRPPDFRELVGDDLPAEEEARLRRVHDLLVEATPPPELPSVLEHPPAPRRRAWLGGLALAAALAAGAFVGGYFVGHRGGFETWRSVPMHGVGDRAAANALIDVAKPDDDHNYPIQLRIRGLPPLEVHGYYVLYLTLRGKVIATCGIFTTGKDGTAEARMTFPYDVGKFDGWIITRGGQGGERQVLLTT